MEPPAPGRPPLHRRPGDGATLVAADRARLDEIPITNPTRTIVDLAGVLRPFELELAMEDAFRRGLSAPSAVAKRLESLGGSGRSGVRKLRRLLAERSGEQMSGSAAEVRLERLLVRQGLPSPVRQHDVTHGGRTVRVDLAYPEQRLAIEFDSLRWHTGRGRLENDAERRNLLQAAGWDLVTVTYGMFRDPARLARTVASARERSCAKFGQGSAGFRA